MMRPFMSIILLTFLGCGGDDNVADCEKGKSQVPCSERTPDENIRLAIEEEDWNTAIELLSQEIANAPTDYYRYPLLAAAYAARAQFDIFNVAKAQFNSGGTLLDQMSSFLPSKDVLGDAAYALSIKDMQSAVSTLKGIPAELLQATSAETYAASANLQTTLYQSAYSVMYLNQFAVPTETGDLDVATLESMSDEDAAIILENLAQAAAVQQGEDGAVLQGKINEALTEIDGQDGLSDKDKLVAFMQESDSSE